MPIFILSVTCHGKIIFFHLLKRNSKVPSKLLKFSREEKTRTKKSLYFAPSHYI